MMTPDRQLEDQLIEKLRGLKYRHRPDIRDRAALEKNFREKFEALNRVTLTDAEFQRLLDEIVTPDVFTASRTLRDRNSFTRDDGTPLNYTLVNIKDWCKNSFEVVNQLRINTDYSHHRYDVMLLINGVPVVQIELKTLGISPRRAMQQIVDYNERFGTNHSIHEFDDYYKDVQQRIKDQQHPNADLPKKGAEKLDLTIVVDMLLTGFDSKYLNTLYVDKNLKHQGLIQAFSRTNRILNATKPYGQILDFRGQQDNVDEAITLFSGAKTDNSREIWLVDKAPVVIEQFKQAKAELDDFLKSQDLEPTPDAVANLMGDDARAAFIKQFKEVQRLQTQLDQYTDLTDEQKQEIEQVLPKDTLREFRGAYLAIAQRLREQQARPGAAASPAVDDLDFELVLFASATIDYDYIMNLIARFTGQDPKKLKISREQLIGLIESDAKFLDEREEIAEYVRSLEAGKGLDEKQVKDGYQRFKAEKQAKELADLAGTHGLPADTLETFVDGILGRMIFDGEQLVDLLAPLDLSWRERTERELALMDDLVPLLKKRAAGRRISGLKAYEE